MVDIDIRISLLLKIGSGPKNPVSVRIYSTEYPVLEKSIKTPIRKLCFWCKAQFSLNCHCHWGPCSKQNRPNIQMWADCTVKFRGYSLCLFLLLGAAALWWLSSCSRTLLPGTTLNFFFAPGVVCFSDISIPILNCGRCGLAAFIRLGFSFLWLGRSSLLLCLLCLRHKQRQG